MEKAKLEKYKEELLKELKEDILEFWMKNVIDYDDGGFFGAVGGNGKVKPGADKGVIMATRILWTFSRAYMKLKDGQYLKTAEIMYKYITEHFVDKKNGGVFWILDHKGKPVDSSKKFYGQAFAIYGFAEFAKATGDSNALAAANELFELVEKYGRDKEKGGYIDALGSKWEEIKDTRLSSRDMNTPKTMNTNLHVMEAFSTLAGYYGDSKVKESLENLVEVFLSKIILKDRHFGLFFDMDWNEVSGKISFGHDIEGSWLLTEAAKVTGKQDIIKRVSSAAMEMADVILREGIDADGGLLSEKDADGHIHKGKEWWMQVEAMVGFFNAYEITGKEIFIEKSLSIWEYCKRKFMRQGGEWYSNLDENGNPDKKRDLAGPWKCPYHTVRACMEIYERIENILRLMGFN